MDFFIVRFQNGCKKAINEQFFANVFFVIEDSTEDEIKSKVNINFGSVKYFDNVHKMDNSRLFELRFHDNTFIDRSTQYKFQM